MYQDLCVCVCVCVCLYMYVCVCLCMFVCLRAGIQLWPLCCHGTARQPTRANEKRTSDCVGFGVRGGTTPPGGPRAYGTLTKAQEYTQTLAHSPTYREKHHIYIHIYTYTYAHLHIYTRLHIFTCTHCIDTYVRVHTYTHVYRWRRCRSLLMIACW